MKIVDMYNREMTKVADFADPMIDMMKKLDPHTEPVVFEIPKDFIEGPQIEGSEEEMNLFMPWLARKSEQAWGYREYEIKNGVYRLVFDQAGLKELTNGLFDSNE